LILETIFLALNCIGNKLRAKNILARSFQEASKIDNDSNILKLLSEQYYQFVYHTIAIEGNTLTFQQVRDVLKTGKARINMSNKTEHIYNDTLFIDKICSKYT
jgi:Fic family protein